MAEIYLSYAKLDHERVKPLIERLRSLGYSVSCGDATIAESESAHVVLALWSAHARGSARIAAEAAHAYDRNKLAQARLDPLAPPAPFRALPAANLSGAHAEFGQLEDAIARIARGEAPAHGGVAWAPFWQTPTCLGVPKLVAFATIATVAAFVGAISAIQNGLMAPAALQAILWGCIGVSALCAALSGLRRLLLWRAG